MQVGEQIVELAVGENGFVAGHVHASVEDGLADGFVVGGATAGEELFAEDSGHAGPGKRLVRIRIVAVAAGLSVETLAVEFLLGERTSDAVGFVFASGEKKE